MRLGRARSVAELFKARRHCTVDDVKRIIFLRYNSLTSFEEVHRTHVDIGKHLRICVSTVRNVITRFHARGHDFARVYRKKTSFVVIPANIKVLLREPATLQHWSPFSLVERVAILKQVLGFTISPSTLRLFYRAHNIAYLTAKVAYTKAIRNRSELDILRKSYAIVLGNVILNRRYLAYCDETTHTTWAVKAKSWGLRTGRQIHGRHDVRLCVTVYAMISTNALLRPIYLVIPRTTNQVDFRTFIRMAEAGLRRDIHGKVYLVHDGHSSHLTRATKTAINRRFTSLQTPSHSCEFNAAEHLFAMAKHNLKKLLLLHQERLDIEDFTMLVRQSYDMITERQLQGVLKANRKHIRSYLGQA